MIFPKNKITYLYRSENISILYWPKLGFRIDYRCTFCHKRMEVGLRSYIKRLIFNHSRCRYCIDFIKNPTGEWEQYSLKRIIWTVKKN